MRFKQCLMVSCALTAALGAAAPAFAQAAAAAAAQPPEGVLGEVVVTANKRVENLQNVAATVTAVSQDTLVRQGVKEITDITKVVPELKVATGQFSNVTIRGVRTGAFGPSTNSPNAVHVDGVYISRFTSLQGLFFDTQRVEVLAGPQGTLYGRNSAGGTINVITNKPTQQFGGEASIEYGNYDALTVNSALNIPINDQLAIRGAYFHNAHKGYADTGLDDADQDSFRVSGLWKPTSVDSLLITGDREAVGGRGAAPAIITGVIKQPAILTSPTGTVSAVVAGTAGSVVVPITAAPGPHDQKIVFGNQDNYKQNTRSGGIMGQYDHDFGFANLTFQAAYRTTFSHNTTGTITGFSQDPRLETAAVIRPAAPGQVDANSKWNTQELRLTSPGNQELTYVIGAYRFHENSYDNHNLGYNVTYPNTSAATVGTQIYTNTVVSDIANPKNIDDAYAAFGQATFTPSGLSALHLTGGLRYNWEKKSASGYELLNGLLAPASVFDTSATWDDLTYKANISYDLTPHNMVYFDHSTGFKSGGFAYGFTPQYAPEKIWSYEIGTKNRFLDNRLQINASAWYYDYRNQTTTINQFYFDTNLGRTNSILNTANARSTHILGKSVTIQADATQNDLVDFSVTHLRARYSSYDLSGTNYALALASGTAGPGATAADFNYSGTPVGNIPDWVFNGSYDHIFRLSSGDLDAQVAVHYTGKQLWGNQVAAANVNNYIVGPAQTTGDVSLRYQSSNRRWSLTGYVRNFTNTKVLLSQGYSSNGNFLATSDPRVTFAYSTAAYGPPRTFGIILDANF